MVISPRALANEAIRIKDSCLKAGGKAADGGFLTWKLDTLNKYVTDLRINLDDAYREL